MSKYKFILIGCALLFFACKAVKTVQSPAVPPQRGISSEHITKQLLAKELQYQWLSTKAKIEFTSKGNTTSVKATIRIKNDSAIWMSVTPGLGIEAVRLIITKDSVVIMDRINNKYTKMDIGFISSKIGLPVDLQILEQILTGKLVFYDVKNDTITEEKNNYLLTSDMPRTSNEVNVSKDVLITGMKIKDKKVAQRVEVVQTEYIPVDNKYFPTKRDINIYKNDTVNVRLEFSNLKVNEPLLFPFTIPAKYEEIK